MPTISALRLVRVSQGITLDEVRRQSGIGLRRLSEAERGQVRLRQDEWLRLLPVLFGGAVEMVKPALGGRSHV